MAKQQPDDSYCRDGRELSAWLWDLAADEASKRLAAGEALQAMLFRVPSVHTDWDEVDWGDGPEAVNPSERFNEAVRAAITAPAFPTATFVQRLIARRIWLQNDWLQRVARAFKRDEVPTRCEARLSRRIQNAGTEAEREAAVRRLTRLACATAARESQRQQTLYGDAESMTAAGVMASIVFNALGEALLFDRPGLRAMLEDETLFQDAAGALARIGPAAVDFAGFFLERLSSRESPHGFDGAEALGSIGREDPVVIDALLLKLRAAELPARFGAAQALGYAGPPLAGRLEAALDLLLNATHVPTLAFAAIPALASVGRDRFEAMERVVELAAPRPPRWRALESCPEHRDDEEMQERGIAIEALARFQRFAGRVVPTLIDAFDTFEEYDPDQCYHGDHARVCDALAAFGAQAAPVVPRLVRFLDQWWDQPDSDRTWPNDVFRVLAAIGPAAADALSVLTRFHEFEAAEDGGLSESLESSSPLHQAIQTLRGGTERGNG